MSGDDHNAISLLRIDLQQLARRQADDARILHGRFKSFDQKHDALASSVGSLQAESASQTKQLEYLVAAEKKRERESEAEKDLQVALTKHKSERRGLVMKIIAGILGLFGVAAASR